MSTTYFPLITNKKYEHNNIYDIFASFVFVRVEEDIAGELHRIIPLLENLDLSSEIVRPELEWIGHSEHNRLTIGP
jgi:hypothetical protein